MKKQLIFITLLSLLVFVNVKAQNWGGGADESKLSFGFSFQVNSSELKILKTANWQTPYPDPITGLVANNYLKSISPLITQGGGAGGLINLRLTTNLDIHFVPMYIFGNRKMLFTYDDKTSMLKENRFSLIEFPLRLKLKSDRLGNTRAYVLGGLKYSFDIASDKNVNIIPELKFKKSYLSYEAGLGMDFYLEWFKVSPEFKVSHSLNDILKHEGNVFDSYIEKAKLRNFTFSIFIN
jgi:hypothetical protein